MNAAHDDQLQRARSCVGDEIHAFLESANEAVLAAVLDNPFLNENHVCTLLERKDIGTSIIEQIVGNKELLISRLVRIALVMHPHTPRRVALRLAREMYLMDLVNVSLRPSAPVEVRRFADDLLLTRIPQLPLGQKLSLAARASGRIAGALLATGHPRVFEKAIANPRLAESHILRVLAGREFPVSAMACIARQEKWSSFETVRAALVRHPNAPLDLLLPLISRLSLSTLNDLLELEGLRPEISAAIRCEIDARKCRPAADWNP